MGMRADKKVNLCDSNRHQVRHHIIPAVVTGVDKYRDVWPHEECGISLSHIEEVDKGLSHNLGLLIRLNYAERRCQPGQFHTVGAL